MSSSPVSLLAQDTLIAHHARPFAERASCSRRMNIVERLRGDRRAKRPQRDHPADIAGRLGVRRRAATAQRTDRSPGSPALLMYTSGTTGTPKGALLSHANLLYAGARGSEAHALTAADRVLSSLPLYHVNGQCIATCRRSVGRQRRDPAPLQRVAMVGLGRALSADMAQRRADDHAVSAERRRADAGAGDGVPGDSLRALGLGAAATGAASGVRVDDSASRCSRPWD